MASKEKGTGAVIVQSVLPPELAEQLRAQAELERRSISATIRNALEDQLRARSDPMPFPGMSDGMGEER